MTLEEDDLAVQNTSLQQSGLKEQEVDAICRVLAENPAVEQAVLYGSRAKGTPRPGSDIDLSLKGLNLNHRDLLDLEMALDDLLLPYKIDINLYHQIDSPALIEHIERVGNILFSK